MGGWGGVIASGLAGAASGMGAAVVDDINEKQKAEAQRLRDEQLARLTLQNQQTMARFNADLDVQNIGLKADATTAAALRNEESNRKIKVGDAKALAEAKASEPQVIGGALYIPGENGAEGTWKVPPKVAREHTPEEKEKIAAEIENQKSQTAYHRSQSKNLDAKTGIVGAATPGKVTATSEKFTDAGKTEDGIPMRRGDVSGIIVYTEPPKEGTPAKEPGAISKFFGGEGKPAVPGTNPRDRYFLPSGAEITKAQYEDVLAGTGSDRKAAARDKSTTTPDLPAPDRVPSPEPSKSSAGKPDALALAAEAKAAIARGAPSAAVRARYKQMTGRDLI